MELLNGEVLYKKIDEPLDEVLKKFTYSLSAEITQKEFNSFMRSFTEHLKNYRIIIFTTQVRANESSEIIWLTEKYYQDHETKGYEGALYDVTTQGREGIESVLEGIIETIKSNERGKYISSILTKYFTFLDWDMKKEILKEIFDEFGHIFPPQLVELQLSQLVPKIEELINLIITTNQTVMGILNRSQTETI
jgi:hypothetical protein